MSLYKKKERAFRSHLFYVFGLVNLITVIDNKSTGVIKRNKSFICVRYLLFQGIEAGQWGGVSWKKIFTRNWR